MSLRRRAGWLTLLGVSTGAVAAAVAAAANASLCAGDPGAVCLGLVRTLSLRVGVVTGAFTVILALAGLGLSRMTAEDERRRLNEGVARPD